MHLYVSNNGGEVSLHDIANFRDFALRTDAEMSVVDATLRRRKLGVAQGEHSFLDPDAIAALAQAPDSTWEDSFAAMIDYAKQRGWVDERGRVRAHVDGSCADDC